MRGMHESRPVTGPSQVEPDQLLTIEEVAPRLRVTVPALRAQVHKGTAPPSVRIGKRRLFSQRQLEQWLAEKLSHAA